MFAQRDHDHHGDYGRILVGLAINGVFDHVSSAVERVRIGAADFF